MYTQCPECQISFRVTARVLQQAGGKVRCGSCGNAFSALDHLSEDMPESSSYANAAAGGDAPAGDMLEETSRRLLETLDELAGPEEVRIEDTGVEWRVLDEADAAIAENNLTDTSDTGSMQMDDDADDDNIPEITADVSDDSSAQEPLNLQREKKSASLERRYDDNTPLPDDFDDEEDLEYLLPDPQRRESDVKQDSSEFDELQGDLALSEPGEWRDLLDEVGDADAIPLEVEEELAAIHSQLSTRESSETTTPPPVAVAEHAATSSPPVDLDSQFEMQAEALGITGTQEIVEEDETGGPREELTDEVPLLDSSFYDPEENDEDLSAGELELSAEDPDDEHGDGEIKLSGEHFEDDGVNADIEVSDEEFGEEKRIGESDHDESAQTDLPDDEDDEEIKNLAGEESTSEFEAQIEAAARALLDEDEDEDEDDPDEVADGDDSELQFEESEVGDLLDDVERIATEDIDDPVIELDVTAEDESGEDKVSSDADEDTSEDRDDIAAREQTDDELAATVFGADHASKFFDENSGEVETIIMEGEFIRGAIEQESLAAEKEAQARISEASKLADTYAINREKMRGGRRSYDPPSYVIVIGVALLAVALLAQIVHASRDSLATSDLFSRTVAPLYRILGQPITPEWDIKGWQFEATSGSTDENEEVLTIVSRIANNASAPLPYPLVHVSLTDRWEEIIGSRVLEPNEYLAGDLDPSKPITPGENFTAVITIENPSEDATGFKLNVCYRVVPRRVRCAIEDFKD